MKRLHIVGPISVLALFAVCSVSGIKPYLYSDMNSCEYNSDCEYGQVCVDLVCDATIKLHSCSSDDSCEGKYKCIDRYCRDPDNNMPEKRRSPGPWSKLMVQKLKNQRHRYHK
ncbi:uncharacterized protein LOC144436672 [Glandiceps talaboti]